MKISKAVYLVMWWAIISSMWVMAVSAKNLENDLNNALQHISTVKFIPENVSDSMEATLGKTPKKGTRTMSIVTPNFVLTQSGNLKNDITDSTLSSISTILWWVKNKISSNWNVWDTILAWSGNSITSSKYSTILWWEENSIKNCDYSTILWWKGNRVEKGTSSCQDSNVIGWSNNEAKWSHSTVVWNNSSVEWNYSVAMWSGSKVKANNSFLWTDGNHWNEVLTDSDVFAVVSERWMVINTGKAHDLAQLTIWGPLVVWAGTDFACNSSTKWSLRVINYDNSMVCFCSCDGSGWNSLYDRWRCSDQCKSNDRLPVCWTDVFKICSVDLTSGESYYYSWTCKVWEVVMWTWSYLVDKDNKVHWSCQTEAGNITGCVAEVSETVWTCQEPVGCEGTLPENAQLWDGAAALPRDSLTNHYRYEYSSSSGPCKFKCKDNFTWNSTTNRCEWNTTGSNCSSMPYNPAWMKDGYVGANWLSNGWKYNQKWNGVIYNPAGVSPTFEANKDCYFGCKEWSHRDSHYRCIKDDATGTCGALPDSNSEYIAWNTYPLVYRGNGVYIPANGLVARYSEDPKVVCAFKCKPGFKWNGTNCAQNDGVCTVKPLNTVWVKGTFHQTRNGDLQTPENQPQAKYDPTGVAECSYKCKTNFVWDGNGCSLTGTAVSTHVCQGTLPAYAKLWNDKSPSNDTTNYTYSETSTQNPCKFRCDDGYKWENNACVKGDTPTPTPTPNCTIEYPRFWSECCEISESDPNYEKYRCQREDYPNTENNDNKCVNHTSYTVCEECSNYGWRCYRPYFEREKLGYYNGKYGYGLCVKRNVWAHGAGECVHCFGWNEAYINGSCQKADCGETLYTCKKWTAGDKNGNSWTCTLWNNNVWISTVSCGTEPDPEPELYSNVTYGWIDYCHRHPNGGCVDCNKWPEACQATPQTQHISSDVWINLVVELGFFKDWNYISDDSIVIWKKWNTDIKLSDIDWSITVGDYSDKVNSNWSIKKYWMTIPDSVTVPWGATTTVRFKWSYDGTVLIDESLTEKFVKDEASCKVDSNGNISWEWFNASWKICSA